ncbi:MAG: hypothetical protein ABJA82_00605 [Myxococcales bacterium]
MRGRGGGIQVGADGGSLDLLRRPDVGRLHLRYVADLAGCGVGLRRELRALHHGSGVRPEILVRISELVA